jgi:membrane-bound lytic murein transglycosylase D
MTLPGKALQLRGAAVYPVFMRPARRVVTGGSFVFAATLAALGCSSSSPAARPVDAAGKAAQTNGEAAMTLASREFAIGREAALAGNFACAREHFQQAIDAVQPAGGPAALGVSLAFSYELYDGIQRYEALAGATEEAGTSHGQVAPELAEIEAPVATEEAITSARVAVDSDMPTVTSDVPIVVNDAVLRVIAAFQSDALHDKIAAGLSRSGRYVPMIQSIFAQEGLPQDLAMIAFIESSFLPHARSPRAAQGIWQFMPRTGREYGLKSNGVVDERSDPEKATRAAARYLTYLHEIFGDWYLAMAAYNAGEGKILRAMQRTGARDFWALAATGAIRRQTQNYVPAFLASVLISKNPSHYGFEVVLETPIEYESVNLDRPVELQHLAEGAGFALEDLQALNPELRSAVTPAQPEGYLLKIPSGQRETVRLAYAAVPTARPPAFRTHVTRKGETLPRIARHYGVSVASLAAANSLNTHSRISRGQDIMVPEKVASAKPAQSKSVKKKKSSPTRVAQASPVPAKKTLPHKSYKVRTGDTLYRIALKHGTTVAEILAINSLGGASAIRPGDQLKIPKGK